ncbi:MAG: DUF5665 domain-containing protein [Bacillota bacterium]
MFGRRNKFRILGKKLDRLALDMERSKIKDYVYYLEHPRKLLLSNFLAGLARGFGASIGFTLMAALVIYILQRIVRWNLPIIGKFISDIVNIVNNNLKSLGR